MPIGQLASLPKPELELMAKPLEILTLPAHGDGVVVSTDLEDGVVAHGVGDPGGTGTAVTGAMAVSVGHGVAGGKL